MNLKKVGKALLFPHFAVLIVLTPLSAAVLIYALIYLSSDSLVSILSYALAFYILFVWSLKVPKLVLKFKNFKTQNKYARRWTDDTHLRVTISLFGSLILNSAYAIFQLGLGFYHRSFWYFSLFGYYILLAVMRASLAQHTKKYDAGEKMRTELIKYRACGIVFLVMNTVLTVMIFFMVHLNRSVRHHEITTIAMAAYTVTSMTLAVINIVKYRKYQSPVYSASKAISLAAACVSMLTLESTMLATFGNEKMTEEIKKLFLGISGGAVSVFVILMAVYMIVGSTKKIRNTKKDK